MISKYTNVFVYLALGIPDATTVMPKTTTGKLIFVLQSTRNNIMT